MKANARSLWHDFPSINGELAFSRRAIDALSDLLKSNGELLPLITPSGEFYAFNPTTIADVLDVDRSVADWLDRSRSCAPVIRHYEFDGRALDELVIFRIPQQLISVYVTDKCVKRVNEAGVIGFNPIKVWLLSRNVDWMRESARADKARVARGLPRGKSPEQESVVVRLALSRGNKGTPVERAKIEVFMDQIDALLVDLKSSGPLVGSLKGHEYAGRECDLYLVCLDAKRLAAKLAPWAAKIAWDGEVQMIERKVAYDVAEGREQNIALARPVLPTAAPRLKPLTGVVPTEYRD